MEWIDARYELPDKEKYDWVLVLEYVCEGGFFAVPTIAEYRSDGKWHLQNGNIIGDDEEIVVAYWMPLPDFPPLASLD